MEKSRSVCALFSPNFKRTHTSLVVDDQLPYDPENDTLMCMSAHSPRPSRSRLWPSLLEKAVSPISFKDKLHAQLCPVVHEAHGWIRLSGVVSACEVDTPTYVTDGPDRNSSIDLQSVADILSLSFPDLHVAQLQASSLNTSRSIGLISLLVPSLIRPAHLRSFRSDFERERTWDRLSRGFHSGKCLVTLGTGPNPTQYNKDFRLLPSHSYAVTGAPGSLCLETHS